MKMARAEVSLGSAAPFLDEVVVQSSADCAADHGDEAGGPFFGNFDTELGGDALDNTRDETLDDFFFDEVAAEINSSSSRGGDPQLDDFIVGRVIESVNQAELLEHAHSYNGEEAHVGKDSQQAAHSNASALESSDFAGGFDGLFGDVVKSGDRKMEHVVSAFNGKAMGAAEILEIGRGIEFHAGVSAGEAGFDGLDECFARFHASWRPVHRSYCMPVRTRQRLILAVIRGRAIGQGAAHFQPTYKTIVGMPKFRASGDFSSKRVGRTRGAQPSGEKPKGMGGFLRLLPEAWVYMRPQRWLLGFGLVLMAINRLSGLVLPASTKFLVDNVVGKHQARLLLPLAAAILAATAVQGITSYSLTQLLSKAAQRMIADLRRQVQSHIGRLSIAFHDTNKTGALVTRIMSDVEGLRNLIGTGLVDFVGSLMTGLFALVVLLRISVAMTALTFVVLLGFAVALNWAIGTIRPIYRARSKLSAEVSGRLTESLAGVRVVKGYHAEGREEDVFAGGVARLLENVLKTLTATSLMSFASTVLLGLVSALVMYLGTRQILSGTMTLGTFLTYVAFLALLVSPIFQIVAIGTQLSEGMAGLERTSEILEEVQEHDNPDRALTIGPIRGEVDFENVSFAYTEGKPVLQNVTFAAKPGTVTALVGPSGAGKSTIIGLIAAFYVPTAGRVLVDGVDLSKVKLESYRTQLGVVLQDTFLFDGTIRENVVFSRPNATEEQVLAACRIARVDEFAEGFEQKYDTVVGERGVKLSGGQRQRISIARAILADPRILILDEATSSLDSESEALIQQGLSYLMRGRTTFVIAHRLSTIRRAEQILVVEEGRIRERGTHESLYALGGRYFDLYTKQHGLEKNLFLSPGEGDGSKVPEPGDGTGTAAGNGAGEKDSKLSTAARLLSGRNS